MCSHWKSRSSGRATRWPRRPNQTWTVQAFQERPVEILGFTIRLIQAKSLLVIVGSGLLLHVIALAGTIRTYDTSRSNWVFHLHGRLPLLLGAC